MLAHDADHLAAVALGKEKAGPATPDLTSFADLASDCFEQDLGLGLLENHHQVLQEIDEALLRIETGMFGICEACGGPVSIARLKAIPYARLCLNCKRRQERSEQA